MQSIFLQRLTHSANFSCERIAPFYMWVQLRQNFLHLSFLLQKIKGMDINGLSDSYCKVTVLPATGKVRSEGQGSNEKDLMSVLSGLQPAVHQDRFEEHQPPLQRHFAISWNIPRFDVEQCTPLCCLRYDLYKALLPAISLSPSEQDIWLEHAYIKKVSRSTESTLAFEIFLRGLGKLYSFFFFFRRRFVR